MLDIEVVLLWSGSGTSIKYVTEYTFNLFLVHVIAKIPVQVLNFERGGPYNKLVNGDLTWEN